MDDFQRELMGEAFLSVMVKPGTDYDAWRDMMLRDCGLEIVDALGTDPDGIEAGLAELWRTPYRDDVSGIVQPLYVWSALLAHDEFASRWWALVSERKDVEMLAICVAKTLQK